MFLPAPRMRPARVTRIEWFSCGILAGQDAVSAAKYGTVSASYVVEAVGALATRQPTETKARERLAAIAERTVQ